MPLFVCVRLPSTFRYALPLPRSIASSIIRSSAAISFRSSSVIVIPVTVHVSALTVTLTVPTVSSSMSLNRIAPLVWPASGSAASMLTSLFRSSTL